MTAAPPTTGGRRAAGWVVHAYTASGAVLALLGLLAAVDGDLREAFTWLLAAMFVDASDGTLARRVDVERAVPQFDGALLDNLVDYLTYVFVPVVLLQQNGFLPAGRAGLVVAALPVLASCYQFCRTDAKTEDHLFLGFPSYWNVVAFYAVVLDLGVAATTATLLVLTVLVFVPIGYLYPSRATAFQRSGVVLGVLWALASLVLLAQLPDASHLLGWVTLLYIAYYFTVSFVLTARRRRPAA
jgi:phosphatidylcholine synthase